MWGLLTQMIQQVIALAVAGIVEGTGIPWPGSIIMAAAGMTAGSLIQYGVGRAIGPTALNWLSPQQRAKVEQVVERFGFGAVCWSRPLAIGNYVSIPAGMLRMNPVRFTLYTFAGALPWSAGTVLLGRFLGDQFTLLPALLNRWMLPAVGLLALAVVLRWLVRDHLRRLQRPPAVPGRVRSPS